MSKYEGCGLAYIDGYDLSYMDEDIEDDEINDSEGYEDEYDDCDYDEDWGYVTVDE